MPEALWSSARLQFLTRRSDTLFFLNPFSCALGYRTLCSTTPSLPSRSCSLNQYTFVSPFIHRLRIHLYSIRLASASRRFVVQNPLPRLTLFWRLMKSDTSRRNRVCTLDLACMFLRECPVSGSGSCRFVSFPSPCVIHVSKRMLCLLTTLQLYSQPLVPSRIRRSYSNTYFVE